MAQKVKSPTRPGRSRGKRHLHMGTQKFSPPLRLSHTPIALKNDYPSVSRVPG